MLFDIDIEPCRNRCTVSSLPSLQRDGRGHVQEMDNSGQTYWRTALTLKDGTNPGVNK